MSVLSGVGLKQCLLVDQNLPAALGLSRSGSQRLSEVSVLEYTNLDIMQSTCYLAEIPIRRLVNRIHSFIYPRKKHILSLSSTSLMTNGDSPTDSSAEDISTTETILDKLHSHSET